MRNFARLWSIARGNKPKDEKNLILPARHRGSERLPERVQRHQPPHQGRRSRSDLRQGRRVVRCRKMEQGHHAFCRTSKTTTREPARPTRFRSTSPAPISRTAVTTRPRSCSTPTAAPSAAVLSSKMPKGCTPCASTTSRRRPSATRRSPARRSSPFRSSCRVIPTARSTGSSSRCVTS